jgi:hypothetical protein
LRTRVFKDGEWLGMDFADLIKKYENFKDIETIFVEFQKDMDNIAQHVSFQRFDDEDRGRRFYSRILNIRTEANTLKNNMHGFGINEARAWTVEKIKLIQSIYDSIPKQESLRTDDPDYHKKLLSDLVNHCVAWLKTQGNFTLTGNPSVKTINSTNDGGQVVASFKILLFSDKIRFKIGDAIASTIEDIPLYEGQSHRLEVDIESQFLKYFYTFAHYIDSTVQDTIPPMTTLMRHALHWEALDRLATLVAQLRAQRTSIH